MKPISTQPMTQSATIKEVRTRAVPDQEALGDFATVRFLSVPLSTWLINASVSPDGATFLMFLWGVIGVILIATGSYWLMWLGAIALILHHVFDYVDGEMACYLDARSWAGHFLESVSHDLVFGAFFPTIGWVLYQTYEPNVLFILLGTLAGLFSVLNRNLRGKIAWSVSSHLQGMSQTGTKRIANIGGDFVGEPKSFIKKASLHLRIYLFGYQHMIFFYLPLALIFGRLDWFLIFYCVGFPLVYFLKVVAFYRSGRRERQAG